MDIGSSLKEDWVGSQHPPMDGPSSPAPASPLEQYLQRLYDKLRLEDGQVATYIPELGRAGILVLELPSRRWTVGSTMWEFPGSWFTIQSISKPLVYGLALEILRRQG